MRGETAHGLGARSLPEVKGSSEQKGGWRAVGTRRVSAWAPRLTSTNLGRCQVRILSRCHLASGTQHPQPAGPFLGVHTQWSPQAEQGRRGGCVGKFSR